jgi:hypothetical protein
MHDDDFEPLRASLDDLLDDFSMPEIVAALARISRDYKAELMLEDSTEYLGWAAWESSLGTALRVAAGDEADSLLG